MSKIALTPDASGSGTFTIAAPNSDTDRTLNLPDEAGTVLSSGTPLSSFPSGFANGIIEADSWRITTTTSAANNAVLSSNWERVDDDGFAKLGTGLSESSGVFSFPSTGYWWINVQCTYNRTNGSSSQAGITLNYTSDNFSTNSDASEGEDSTSATNFRAQVSVSFIFKITDITNEKFRLLMLASSPSGTEFLGNTSATRTGFNIFKVGEV